MKTLDVLRDLGESIVFSVHRPDGIDYLQTDKYVILPREYAENLLAEDEKRHAKRK